MTKNGTRARLERELARATAQSQKLSEARAALPPGSSRARVTSANAKWARVAEYRDLVASQLAALDDPSSPMQEAAPVAQPTTVRMVAVSIEGDDEAVSAALQALSAEVSR